MILRSLDPDLAIERSRQGSGRSVTLSRSGRPRARDPANCGASPHGNAPEITGRGGRPRYELSKQTFELTASVSSMATEVGRPWISD